MTTTLDTACPWCGEELTDPFTGRDVTTQSQYDTALEAHTMECEPFLAEMGGDVEL